MPPQPSMLAVAPSTHLHRIDREQLDHEFEVVGVADLEERRPGDNHAFAFLDEPRTRPLTGARTVTQHPTGTSPFQASSGPISRAWALSSSRLRTSRLALARVKDGLPGIDVDARALQGALGNGLGLDEGLRASEFALGELGAPPLPG